MAYNGSGRGSRGEMFSHWTGVRLRMVGDGELKMQMQGLDTADYSDLLPLNLSSTPGVEPFRGSNFVNQRMMFKGYTTDKDEVFEINRIVLFGANLWSEYPQVE